MRILFASTRDLFRLSLGKSLEKMGHEVTYHHHFQEHALHTIFRKIRPHLIMNTGWDLSPIQTATLAKVVKQYPVFRLYFAEEDDLHYRACSLRFCRTMQPHLILTRSESCIPRYRRHGWEAVYMDVGCNPDFHKPRSIRPHYQCDVSVVANPQFKFDIFRRKSMHDLVIPLFDAPFHTNIWGSGWEKVSNYYPTKARSQMLRGKLPFNQSVFVYNSSKINISLQSVEHQISNRTYDILSSGGFLLTSKTQCVLSKLTPGIHCEVSDSPKETIEKIRYYLEHESERKRIARTGRQLAIEQFSYEHYLSKLWPLIHKQVKHFKQSSKT